MIDADGNTLTSDVIPAPLSVSPSHSPQEMEKRWMALTIALGIKVAALSQKEARVLAQDIFQRYFA